jgi:hypothetical protein
MKLIATIGIAWCIIAAAGLVYWQIILPARDKIRKYRQPDVRVVAQYRDPEDDVVLIVETQRGDGPVKKTKLAIWHEDGA